MVFAMSMITLAMNMMKIMTISKIAMDMDTILCVSIMITMYFDKNKGGKEGGSANLGSSCTCCQLIPSVSPFPDLSITRSTIA